ncbi:hypothetical protein [Flavobacterium crassostreae]|uniref:Prenyltransferase n=1 Tax=Flavobacterium crassostreae TaxID=1763534 RepID=A0A1B9E3Y1_9FLAO|nr:hypothetical protein [Flavobacterium crassostreae]OCB76641.1 hypothetical protein LPBF_06830 [Flavobacterium crassostreae]
MIRLKKAIDFYIHSSIPVALSVYALIQITYLMCKIPPQQSVSNFAFLGTIAGYNFVKYATLVRVPKKSMGRQLKQIVWLSFFALLGSGYYFWQLQWHTQLISLVVLALTLLYALPFFPNKKNARHWAGVKIYIVALCWVGVTLVLPVWNAEIPLGSTFFIKGIQRFILVFVLILIFEILDLSQDDPLLQTVPQQIGVRQTKILGLVLLLPFYFLEFLKNNDTPKPVVINAILVVVLSLFLVCANHQRSKYYTSFWAESIPVFWWLFVVAFGGLNLE